MYERSVNLFTNLNLMAGLMLSALAEIALNPKDVPSLPAEHQTLGDAANIIAAFIVVVQTLITVYTTFIGLELAASGSPSGVYRMLVYFGPLVGYFQLLLWIPTMVLVFGIWYLVFGIWYLVFGI